MGTTIGYHLSSAREHDAPHLCLVESRRGLGLLAAPIHPQSLARAVGSAANSIAAAMELQGTSATKRWREPAETVTHLGKDPSWRSRPSILDQLCGWRITPR